MASPFALFRKNQQTLLVLLFILAMFAFIILSNLNSTTLDLPLLGMLIGTLVLTMVGVGVKKPMQYAAIGAVGGWLAGYVAVWSGFDTASDSIVVKSSAGDLDEIAIANLVQQRRSANDFITRAIYEMVSEEEKRNAAEQKREPNQRSINFTVGQLIDRYAFQMNGSVEEQMGARDDPA